jgi:hypothetical protein
VLFAGCNRLVLRPGGYCADSSGRSSGLSSCAAAGSSLEPPPRVSCQPGTGAPEAASFIGGGRETLGIWHYMYLAFGQSHCIFPQGRLAQTGLTASLRETFDSGLSVCPLSKYSYTFSRLSKISFSTERFRCNPLSCGTLSFLDFWIFSRYLYLLCRSTPPLCAPFRYLPVCSPSSRQR